MESPRERAKAFGISTEKFADFQAFGNFVNSKVREFRNDTRLHLPA